MIVGTTFFKMDGTPYYSPEFGRGGGAAVFAADVTHVIGTLTLTMTVQHRNADEVVFTDLGAFDGISSADPANKDLSGCKEILRIKYEFGAGDASTVGVHLLMQAPSWRPY